MARDGVKVDIYGKKIIIKNACKSHFYIAGWSSLAARVAHNHEVVGSNPTPATFEWERGRENGSFPGVEVLKPQGFKERSDVRFLLPQHSGKKT